MSVGENIKSLRLAKKMTQEDLAKILGVSTQAIYKYEQGIVTNIPLNKIEELATFFNVKPSAIMGWDDKNSISIEDMTKYGISLISIKKIPLLGDIACGQPRYADEDRSSYVEVGTDIKADFCLRAKGDSMINARINDGDIVFVRAQNAVDNGDIAAVIINDEATLKRVYFFPDKNILILKPENTKYKDIIYSEEDLNNVKILGKAIAFQSDII